MALGGELRGSRLQAAIGLVAGLCFFLFGYDQGDLAGLLTVPTFRAQFPQIDTIGNPGSLHTATIQGVTVAAWNIGCFLSAMLTILWGDLIGRKKTIYIGLTFLCSGEIIQACSYSYGQFIAGRVVAGFGNGFNAATVPAWQAECSKAHRRGTLLMISAGACIAAGLSFSYWINFGMYWVEWNSASWRFPIAIQLFFLLSTFVLMHFMPESPRWLILCGREEAALDVLSALNDKPRNDTAIRQEFLSIKDAVIEMAKGSTMDLTSMGDYRHIHRAILASGLQVMQQMSGINLITQYLAVLLLQQFRYERPWVALVISACAGTEFFLASFVAVIGIDRFWGRRSLLMFGASGILIAGTVFVFAFCTFFAIGWQGMAWLYQVEIIPLRIRGPANALSTAVNWLTNFVVVLIAPVAFHSIGYRTFIIFACTNFVSVPIIYFFYPETGFRSLEEVDVVFHAAALSPRPWLSVRKIAANEPLWYGKDGDEPFDYEASEWHQKHTRFSEGMRSSDGGTGSLTNGGREKGSHGSPIDGSEREPMDKLPSEDERAKASPVVEVPRQLADEAAPMSKDHAMVPNSVRGLECAGGGY
ncbi:hypothetical protein Tdes44962_MAKER04297 [Teratosphaeria destructans]|uniref:Major facilitator superfamily (MFS) profile domain-containing protein n=1 Tax=Teratosphaeria destructans TaxID=418781 RepID=A0A9W7SMW1_9PEZI|nr:hypothetical protein Tdes44962_MAKER04297 [Teratosphaeria destructans]